MRNKVLIIDDSKFNRSVLHDALADDYEIIEAEDGEHGLIAMQENLNELAAVLLDIVMPGLGGVGTLKMMQTKHYIDDIPVLVVTGEQDMGIVEECFDYGISDFIRKPVNQTLVRKRVKKIAGLYAMNHDFKAQVEEKTATVKKQYQLLKLQSEQMKKSNEKIIDIMGTIVEYRNLEGSEHVARVKQFVRVLCENYMNDYPEEGLDAAKTNIIVSASALHDIGKILIPDSILLKPGKYTEKEFDYMKSHTIRGAEIIESIKGVWDKEYSVMCADICRHHHERYDGNGYPDRLKGDEVSLAAYIVGIADVYDAMICDRVYKKAYSLEEAYHMILQGECGVFPPKLMECFRNSREDFEKIAKDMSNDKSVG